MQHTKPGCLSEVDQPVKNSDDVVDAEDERVEHTGTAQLEAFVEVVELSEGKC